MVEISPEVTSLIISILALSVTLAVTFITTTIHMRRATNKVNGMLDESEMLCMDLIAILKEYDSHNVEEEYEVDLSLKSYFNDNSVKILYLAKQLKEPQPWYIKNGKSLPKIGDLLVWLVENFYEPNSEEEERIRVWSQNTKQFFNKYYNIFHPQKYIERPA